MAERLYPHLNTPIYIGRFNYGHDAKHFSEEFVQRYGAVHGVYLPFLSDQYKTPWKRGNDFFEHTRAEYLGTQFFNYIAQFMKQGNPNFDAEEIPWQAWVPDNQYELIFDGDRNMGYVKAGVNQFSYDDLFVQYEAEKSVSKEHKSIIASRVLNGRWFGREWDAHYGNPPDPVLR